MADAVPDMIDVTFALSGRSLPANHAFALWREVARILPWLEAEQGAGIIPLRAAEHGDDVLFLPRRARLALRVPGSLAAKAQELAGKTLDVGGHALTVGAAKTRALQPFSTLHAPLVASAASEGVFLETAAAELRQRGINGRLICGKHLAWEESEGGIAGYSLVVHELKPQESLLLQCTGLGGARHLGCGIFVPYKAIADLDD